jgi:hypothetical protein
MRYLLLIPLLCAFTPLYTEHDGQQKTDDEFKNVYQQSQPLNMRVFSSTPNLADVQEGELVMISSNTRGGSYSRLMYKNNLEIYAISGSCVTIRR